MPMSRPPDVMPLPSPQAAFPVGSTIVSAAAIVGAPAVGNACTAAAEKGRSPIPLLDTGPALALSLTCTNDGSTDRLSQGFACHCSTPDSARSDRRSLSFAEPTETPVASGVCALSGAARMRQQSRWRTIFRDPLCAPTSHPAAPGPPHPSRNVTFHGLRESLMPGENNAGDRNAGPTGGMHEANYQRRYRNRGRCESHARRRECCAGAGETDDPRTYDVASVQREADHAVQCRAEGEQQRFVQGNRREARRLAGRAAERV